VSGRYTVAGIATTFITRIVGPPLGAASSGAAAGVAPP
jgi:hypothetical protein